MPSKKSEKHPKSPLHLWKAAPACSEVNLAELARELAADLQSADWIVLEGPLGAGKSTFARYLIQAYGSGPHFEGSPTFPIAHEYRTSRGPVIHLDLYRLRDEADLEQAGVESYFWERNALVLVEWLSQFPDFETTVLNSARRIWRVVLGYPELRTQSEVSDNLRSICIEFRDR